MTSWEKSYEQWNTFQDLDPILKKELAEIKNDSKALEEAFYQELSFGTGGVRGVLGPGTNRLNIYTVRKAISGLANYLLVNYTDAKDRGVVVAYDSRYMSKEFALEVAKVLGVHGIKTYVFESLRPTPLLSFAVRHLRTVSGIMITASHNPPIYNGFKVYNEDGGQATLEESDEIITAVQRVEDGLTVPVLEKEALDEQGLLVWVGDDIDQAYLKELKAISKMDQTKLAKDKNLNIIFTPLHGTAHKLVMEGLKQLNFTNVHVVEKQVKPDPEFSTVTSPNPEEPQAFALAIEQAKTEGGDILLATDPDADRMGIAVKDDEGDFVVLTGNQIGSLLLDYLLSHSDKEDLTNARALKSIVTTELGQAIANSYGVETINTLTGFKFIAEKIREFDETGEKFVFGFEESYGYLINGFARDKDAVQAVTMTCEMAQYWKDKGMTLLDALETIYEKLGFYYEGITQLTLEGIEGTTQIAKIMDHFRNTPLDEIGGLSIEKVEDYLSSQRKSLAEPTQTEAIHLPKENVLKFLLEDNNWACLRPSGTEPKIKCYYGVYSDDATKSKKKLLKLQESLEKMLNEIINTP